MTSEANIKNAATPQPAKKKASAKDDQRIFRLVKSSCSLNCGQGNNALK